MRLQRFALLSLLSAGMMTSSIFAKPALEALAPATSAASKNIVTLEKITSENQDKISSVNLLFNGKPQWTKANIEAHGTFIQILLPNTIVPSPGEFIDGPSPYMQKIVALQITPETGAIRLIVDRNADVIKRVMHADLLNKRLLISLDQTALEAELKAAGATMAASSGAPSADQIVASVAVDKNIPAPAGILQKPEATDATKAAGTSEKIGSKDMTVIQDKFMVMAYFSGAMLLGLMFMYILRPIIRRRRGLKSFEMPAVKIATLATHQLNAKQKLSLIQIGGEKILLSVSADNVNFIKTIGQEAYAPAPAKSHMLASPAQMMQRTLPSKSPSQPVRTPVQAEESSNMNTSSFAVKVDEDGITSVKQSSKSGRNRKPDQQDPERAITDVTKLIREKLKNLPAV